MKTTDKKLMKFNMALSRLARQRMVIAGTGDALDCRRKLSKGEKFRWKQPDMNAEFEKISDQVPFTTDMIDARDVKFSKYMDLLMNNAGRDNVKAETTDRLRMSTYSQLEAISILEKKRDKEQN